MRNAEVKAMIGLKHANIVNCVEVMRHSDNLFMLFELLDMDLYRMMQMRKLNDDPFSHEEVRHIIMQIANSLEYIHSHVADTCKRCDRKCTTPSPLPRRDRAFTPLFLKGTNA